MSLKKRYCPIPSPVPIADRDGRRLGDGPNTVRGVVYCRIVVMPLADADSSDRREFRRAVERAGGVYYFGPDEFRGRHGFPIVCEATEAIEISIAPDCAAEVLSCRFVAGAEIVTNGAVPHQSRGAGELSQGAKRFAGSNKFQKSAVERDSMHFRRK